MAQLPSAPQPERESEGPHRSPSLYRDGIVAPMCYGNLLVTDFGAYGGGTMGQARASGDPFEALSDANRREILRLLSAGDKPVQEIAAAMPISRPAVSRHLRLLKDAGMVTEQAEGTRRIYHLQEQGMHAVQMYLEGIWGEAAARFRLLAENTDRSGRR